MDAIEQWNLESTLNIKHKRLVVIKFLLPIRALTSPEIDQSARPSPSRTTKEQFNIKRGKVEEDKA
jgi:hypothetical protein